MSEHNGAAASELESRVQRLLADVTRYPLELVTLDAHLEDDLGIDSLKQVEIFVRVEAEFGLPKEPRLGRPDPLTPRGIASAVATAMPTAGAPVAIAAAPPAPVAAPMAVAPLATAKAPARIAAPTPVAMPAPMPQAHAEPVSDAIQRLIHLLEKQGAAPAARAAAAPVAPARRRVAWVTGSGRGLGREIALHLAHRGFAVVVNSFHSRESGEATAAEIRARGGEAIHVWGSVANPEQVQRMAAEIEEAYGSLDLLVANASNGYIGPSSEIAPEHWERGFTTNVVGLHRCAVEAARLMALRPQGTRGGRIVALSTVAAQRYLQDFMVQGVLKSAVETLVRYLAVELGGSGITVNAISGGPVYGELIERFPNSAERVRHWEAITPTGKLVAPDEVSRMVEFLADEHMSSVNGAIWTLDGGVSLGIDARLGALDPLAREKWMQVA